ncbi:flagellar biosynthesis protein FliQ [Thiohalorhabdus sp.]|uniref:flagellar biosynthesis protein FliQ n=1 Tax=Thiohalorhabdus sp. TaxID=3094134 RepID=UPI002FC2CCD1
MDSDQVVYISGRALEVTLMVAGPMLGAALVFGLMIAIFQAVTQIQEMTLTFIPKIVAVFIAAMVFASWILHTLVSFTTDLYQSIPSMVAGG